MNAGTIVSVVPDDVEPGAEYKLRQACSQGEVKHGQGETS